uniref:Uncharacterized protein n=1 Tax=Rhizophora mucronata TaxID=61149 RepID=A0A2P2R1N8_RHIMU
MRFQSDMGCPRQLFLL